MVADFPPLPEFNRPPVIEVVLSLQFEPLAKMQVQHLGFLWSIFKDQFPKVETKPPLDPVIEIFEQKPARPTMRFEVGEFPLLPRVWFVSSTGSEIIQVQSDRFICNWRKVGDAFSYPRYERIRAEFQDGLTRFASFLAEHSLGELKPNQCEITYINHIPAEQGPNAHGKASRILNSLREDFRVPFLPSEEAVQFSSRYLLQREDVVIGKPFGRLYVDMNPAYDAGQEPIFVLNLTVRSAPAKQDIGSAMECYDLGRKYIVCTFDAITTDTMHNTWGKNAL
jgi:uncharacterized protein (TIGR04255 family)